MRWVEILGGEMGEFVDVHLVKCNDIVCPEGSTGNSGVKNVNFEFSDGTFGSVSYAKVIHNAIIRGKSYRWQWVTGCP